MLLILHMSNESPFKLDNQEVEKSIVYELPSPGVNQSASYNSFGAKKYTLKQEVQTESEGRILCLNCNNFIRAAEIDDHCLGHIKLIN